jgi:DNA ligase 1
MKTPNKTMMHGSDYAGEDPTGWLVTEKFDGFFARWTGKTLLTREGKDFHAPPWFTAGLPDMPLDCELFAGYRKRETLNNIHRAKDEARWCWAELVVFDAPGAPGGYEERHAQIVRHITTRPGLLVVPCWKCQSFYGLVEFLATVTERGGEGLVIRHPDALYVPGITRQMLKVKPEFMQA